MIICPLRLEDLPTAARSNLAGERQLEGWLRGLSRKVSFTVPLIGDLEISFRRWADSRAPVPPEDTTLAVELDGQWGRLSIDGMLALHLVSSVLGRTETLILRQLGRSERGVLAAVVAAILVESGSGLRVALDAPQPLRSGCAALVLDVRAPRRHGATRFDVPWAWLEIRVDSPRFEGAALTTTGVLELSTTALPASDWVAVRPGDVVVFDGVCALPSSATWEASLRIGAHAARAYLDAEGVLRLAEDFRPTVRAPAARERHERGAVMSKGSDRASDAADITSVLAAAPIELVAELGRLTLRGDEVVGLRSGSVLTFGGARTTNVSLRVGDTIWAKGELVNVDGELGVRILQVVTGSSSDRNESLRQKGPDQEY